MVRYNIFGIFQGEFGTNVKIRKNAFQDKFLGKNKNVGPLTTLKICCTELTPSEKISLNFEIWEILKFGRDGPQQQNFIKKTGGKAIVFKERKDKYSNEPS